VEDSDDVLLVTGNGGQERINIVKPDLQWRSCGVWQDFLYPCHHACVVYRKWKEKEFIYVLMNLLHLSLCRAPSRKMSSRFVWKQLKMMV
jgi:hypothetical protein